MQITLLTWLNRIIIVLTAYPFLTACFYKYYLRSSYTSEYFLFGFMMIFILGVFQLILIIYFYKNRTKTLEINRQIFKRHIKIIIIYIIVCTINIVRISNDYSLSNDFEEVINSFLLVVFPFIMGVHFTYYLEVLNK